MATNRIAYFLIGAALGAAGAAAAENGKSRQILAGFVKGGFNLKETLLTSFETIREDVEDYLAEARFQHEDAVNKAAEQAQTPPATKAAPKKAKKAATATKAKTAKKAPAKKTVKKTVKKKTATTKTATTKAAAKKKTAPKAKA